MPSSIMTVHQQLLIKRRNEAFARAIEHAIPTFDKPSTTQTVSTTDWHKPFVCEIKRLTGCSHESAMTILALACSQTNDAYKQGYENGHTDGSTKKHVKRTNVKDTWGESGIMGSHLCDSALKDYP